MYATVQKDKIGVIGEFPTDKLEDISRVNVLIGILIRYFMGWALPVQHFLFVALPLCTDKKSIRV
jgi:hypothetical protein